MTKYAFDVWFSDGNNRSCIGVVAVETDQSADEAGWMALDVALKQNAKNPDEWSMPYADPCAVFDGHDDDCECECHDDDEGGCEYCQTTESLAVEPCDDPESDYWHHSRIKLEELEATVF